MFWKSSTPRLGGKSGGPAVPKDPDLKAGAFEHIWGEHMQSARHYRAVSLGLFILLFIATMALYSASTRPHPLPVVVRVDEVGRAQVVDYDAGRATASPDDPVVPYFLTQFVYDHYSRRRAVGTQDWQRSLFFLRQDVARQAVNRDSQEFIRFVNDDDVPERLVENLELRLIPQPEPPYVAELIFDLVGQIYGAEVSRTSMVVSLRFVFAEELTPDSVHINPMGIIIIYLEQQVTIG